MYRQPLEGSGYQYDEQTATFLADSTFKSFADNSGNQLDRQIVVDDLEALKAATREVVALSDEAIAHDDRRGPEFDITFSQLDTAVDVIETITSRYVLLLTGASMLRMTPYDQSDSIRVFRFAWIDHDHRPHLDEALL